MSTQHELRDEAARISEAYNRMIVGYERSVSRARCAMYLAIGIAIVVIVSAASNGAQSWL